MCFEDVAIHDVFEIIDNKANGFVTVCIEPVHELLEKFVEARPHWHFVRQVVVVDPYKFITVLQLNLFRVQRSVCFSYL